LSNEVKIDAVSIKGLNLVYALKNNLILRQMVSSTSPDFHFKEELIRTAKEITAPGKGILAADESTGTIGQRFASISVENNEENRKAYRDLLFTAPGIEQHISGVILFEETCSQASTDGTNFVKLLRSRGIHTGIKLDKGLVNLMGTTGESATTGLDGLADRAKKFYEMGCRFAKWRAVLKIGDGMPSELSV